MGIIANLPKALPLGWGIYDFVENRSIGFIIQSRRRPTSTRSKFFRPLLSAAAQCIRGMSLQNQLINYSQFVIVFTILFLSPASPSSMPTRVFLPILFRLSSPVRCWHKLCRPIFFRCRPVAAPQFYISVLSR